MYKLFHKTGFIRRIIGVERVFGLMKRAVSWIGKFYIRDLLLKRIVPSLLVGVMLMSVAFVYMYPADKAYDDIAKPYALLSEKPLDFSNASEYQVNILSPLIAYVVHLRGGDYLLFIFIVATLFLASVYYFFRYNRGYSFLESLGVSAMMAMSVPISLVLFLQGQPDITTYLLLFLCIVFSRHAWLWLLLYTLALWNHESALFAAPWLFALACWRNLNVGKISWSLGLIGLVIMSWMLFRGYVVLQLDVFECATGYCFESGKFKDVIESTQGYLLLGVFAAFRLFWFWPIYAVYRFIRMPGRRWVAGWLVLVVICSLAQLMVTWDVTRAVGLAFPAILFGAYAVRELVGKRRFKRWLLALLVLNLVLPNIIVRKDEIIFVKSLPQVIFAEYLFE